MQVTATSYWCPKKLHSTLHFDRYKVLHIIKHIENMPNADTTHHCYTNTHVHVGMSDSFIIKLALREMLDHRCTASIKAR